MAGASEMPDAMGTAKSVMEELEEGELRKIGSIYVEDTNEKLYRRIRFTNFERTEEFEVLLFRMGYIEMISINDSAVPLSDFLNISYLGYWDNEWLTVYLKGDRELTIPKISNTMLVQCLTYIGKYPYEIPTQDLDDDDTIGGDTLCFMGIGVLFAMALILWVYYITTGITKMSCSMPRDEL